MEFKKGNDSVKLIWEAWNLQSNGDDTQRGILEIMSAMDFKEAKWVLVHMKTEGILTKIMHK